MSPRFSLSVLGLRSLGMPFLCSLTVPQQEIFFWAKSSNRSGKEKKLSIYSLWPNPSHTPCQISHCSVGCCQVLCRPLSVFTMSYVYPVESHSLNILMLKHLHFFRMYCLNNTLPLNFTMTSSTAKCSEGL